MTNFYPYLIASLPMLHFGMKPPFSYEKFLERCRGLICAEDWALLSGLPDRGEIIRENLCQPAARKWLSYDAALRNELVKVRASRRHIQPQKYLRPDGYAGPAITHIALAAQRNPSILEAEKFLDAERWKALDEISCGHYFDLDALVVYAYKLRILERWESVRLADKQALLEKALAL